MPEILETEDGGKMGVIRPDPRVFLLPPDPRADVIGNQYVYDLCKVECPITGGQYLYYTGVKFPTKGHPYLEAIRDNAVVKRALINSIHFLADKRLRPLWFLFLLLPGFLKKRIIEAGLGHFVGFGRTYLAQHYLKVDRMTENCREILDLIARFFVSFGLPNVGARFALLFAHMLQYDSAYRLRVEDIMSETSKEQLLADPALELTRLFTIYKQRDSNAGMQAKFRSLTLMLKLFLWIPSVRRAFRKAIKESFFANFQYDEIDRASVLWGDDYNFMGKGKDERALMYLKINNGLPPQFKIS